MAAKTKTKTKAKTKRSNLDPGGTSSFKVGNGCEYKNIKGHIKSISGLNLDTDDPIDVVFVPHDGEHEIELVKFTDLENVVRS